MKDVSIEYAHIYTNNKISEEHEISINILSKLKKDLERENKSMSLVIMIDDYSFPDPTFDYKSFTTWLNEKGYAPDVIIRESQLIPVCDMVLENLNDKKLHTKIVDYIKSKKYPCSLFIAAWYLLRLGYLEYDGFNKEYNAKKLINILPESFKPFEDEGLKIISASKFSEAVDKIEYSFIDGRLVV